MPAGFRSSDKPQKYSRREPPGKPEESTKPAQEHPPIDRIACLSERIAGSVIPHFLQPPLRWLPEGGLAGRQAG